MPTPSIYEALAAIWGRHTPSGRPAVRVERYGRSLSKGAAQLLDWLVEHSINGVSCPTDQRLREVLGYSGRTIYLFLAELEQGGLIKRARLHPVGRKIVLLFALDDGECRRK